MHRVHLMALVCPLMALLLVDVAQGQTTRPQPTTRSAAKPTSHTTRTIEGWTVRIDDRLLADPNRALGEQAIKLLTNRLADIVWVVPADKVEWLAKVPIVLDLTNGALLTAQYHPSAGWLRENGYDQSLAHCVHIPDAAYFASGKMSYEQPWAVLHELAHAYHDQVLGFDEPRIMAAWHRFVKSGKYKSVPHMNGRMREHYGLTNQKEFFAEMTEAYFGMNDFFPFNSAELRREEPELFQLMREIWGKLPNE
ncbi:MAG TPA: hypothetical protein VIM11_07775 [Tepidisphaeraceae bacterium]